MGYSRLPVLICGVTLLALIELPQSSSMSGLYVDNGVDQTVLQRTLTLHERQNVEQEILELLGLPDRPVRSRISEKRGRKSRGRAGAGARAAAWMARHRHTHPHLTKSAPQFLLDVYQALSDSSAATAGRSDLALLHDFNITQSDQTAIDESDVIMTFASHSDHVSGLRHERGKRLWFDVSEVAAGQEIVGAELRLYQTGLSDEVDFRDYEYSVAIYMVAVGEREIELVTTVNTTRSYQGWLTLNVTKPLKDWVAFPSFNEGLYLSVHPVKRPGHELRVEDVGIVSSNGDEERQPFMVAFLKAGGKVRTPREAPRNRNKKSEVTTPSEYQRNPFADSSSRWWPKTCQIRNLYVSFKDLEWQDWIIAPDGYGAFYCSGECNFPLNAHMNATNHAVVQTLVHLMNPTEVPKPCCAPTKLTPISVLYFLDDYNVILKKYKNMVVKSCGCQ